MNRSSVVTTSGCRNGDGILAPPSRSPDPGRLPNPAFHQQHYQPHSQSSGSGSPSSGGIRTPVIDIPAATDSKMKDQLQGVVSSLIPTCLRLSSSSAPLNQRNGEDGGDVEVASVQVTGSGSIPGPVQDFAEMEESFGSALAANIRRCGYVKPTAVQKYGIPICFAGRDLMACAQTGSGKTAAFCLPIISGILRRTPETGAADGGTVASPYALILSPTRELASQIYGEAQKFAQGTGIKLAVVYGGTPVRSQLRSFARGVELLVATPGRLSDLMERRIVSVGSLRCLVIDEADRMLDMGFEPQIRAIVDGSNMPPPGVRQTLLFSATFPEDIQKLAAEFMHDYVFMSVGRVGSSTGLIEQKVEYMGDEEEKRQRLLSMLVQPKLVDVHGRDDGAGNKNLVVVFVETKRGADLLSEWLRRRGRPATSIHGDKSQEERESALRSFKAGRTPILVATDVAARGLDITEIGHVVNFDLPKDIDSYVHRIGRTGRAGRKGRATAFFTDKDAAMATEIVEVMEEAKQEVPVWLRTYHDGGGGGEDERRRRRRGCSGSNGQRRRGGGAAGAAASRFGGREDHRAALPSHSITYSDDPTDYYYNYTSNNKRW